jgi:glutathione S-transferase
MKLRYSQTSPYARKVLAFAKEAGVDARIEVTNMPTGLTGELVKENPLGKVPSLVTDEGTAIFDSPVILEYLDSLNAGPKLIPAAGPARWKALTLAALGDGIMDVCVARRGEVLRTKDKSEEFLKKQKDVAASALDALERDASSLAQPITVGQIAVGCALGYMDLRFAEDNWRRGRPKLAAWFDTFSKRPSMASTAPPPA